MKFRIDPKTGALTQAGETSRSRRARLHRLRGGEMNQPWLQNFNPLGNTLLSTIAAAIPVSTLFFFLAAMRRVPAWRAAVYAFIAAVLVALAVFRMPAIMVAGAVADGLVFGWFRIAWIVVAAVFVYDVSVESGQFDVAQTLDRRHLSGPPSAGAADRLRLRRAARRRGRRRRARGRDRRHDDRPGLPAVPDRA